jgi:pilus assembly protein Flp/PilA
MTKALGQSIFKTVARGLRRTASELCHRQTELRLDVKGAAAVEFALLAFPLIFAMLAVCEAGFDLYERSALDYFTANVARQILTGSAQQLKVSGTPLTQQQFITNVVCAKLPAAMTCNNVFVSVTAFSEGTTPSPFYNAVNAAKTGLNSPNLNNALNAYCLGGASQYVIVQIAYPVPLITSLFGSGGVSTYNGQSVRVMTSTASFRNEPFLSSAYTAPTGC